LGEFIGREVAEALKIPFGVVDLSLAPTPNVADSVGEIYFTGQQFHSSQPVHPTRGPDTRSHTEPDELNGDQQSAKNLS
jgi:uncharacterized protein DUF711